MKLFAALFLTAIACLCVPAQAELQQMIDFAKSPAGQHYLRDYAKLESDEAVGAAMSELMESLTPVLEDIQKEMCAAKATQRVAMGDTNAKCPLGAPPTQAG